MNGHRQETCRVCGNLCRRVSEMKLLGRSVLYFDCDTCGYHQTESPYWLEDAYKRAINDADTGIMWRNRLNVGRVLATLMSLGNIRSHVIDFAGGYGVLVRLLRDVGVDAYWRDKYCENLFARGFEASDRAYGLATAFEAFEHFIHPLEELNAMLESSTTVLISTELIRSASPPETSWWYYGREHGQHIGFFRTRTLAYMAKKLGLHSGTDGRTVHIFSRAPIPPSWRLLVRSARCISPIASLMLKSKTNDDSLLF